MRRTTLSLPFQLLTLLILPAAAAGAALEGHVIAAASGRAPERATLLLYEGSFYGPIREAELGSNADGAFRIEGLPAGHYRLAVAAPGLTTQWLRGFDCPLHLYCFDQAEPIVLGAAEVRSGLDFALRGRGSLTGRVTDEQTGQGLANVQVFVSSADGFGADLAETSTDAAGAFAVADLPAGHVYVAAHDLQHRAEYFDDVPFEAGFHAARPIAIEPGGTVAGIDFALIRNGSIRARVVAAESGLALGDHLVKAFSTDLPHRNRSLGYTGPNGEIELKGLAPGRYFLSAAAQDGRAEAVWGLGSCNHLPEEEYCADDGATPIEVRSDEISGPFEIAVEKEAGLEGRFLFAPPRPGGTELALIRVYDAGSREVRQAAVAAVTGYAFAFAGLAPGSYRLVADGFEAWQSQAWPDVPCNRWYCDPARGEAIVLPPGELTSGKDFVLRPLPAYTLCNPSDTALCLNQGRYRVEATWRDFSGASGAGRARTLTGESGYFYFFSEDNVEVMVKALDACEPRLGHRFWIYGAGLTNVAVELRVTDTLSGETRLYSNLLGDVFQPILDSSAFATCDLEEPPVAGTEGLAERIEPWATSPLEPASTDAALCQQEPEPSALLCLNGRYRIHAVWQTPAGGLGEGYAHPLTAETGVFTFFSADNIELVVKVLDACHTANPGIWVFAAGLTDLGVQLTVTDLATGHSRTYHNEFGGFVPIFDLAAFSCD